MKARGAGKYAEPGPGESRSLLSLPLPVFNGYGILHDIDRYWILMTGAKTVTSAPKKPEINPKLNHEHRRILPR